MFRQLSYYGTSYIKTYETFYKILHRIVCHVILTLSLSVYEVILLFVTYSIVIIRLYKFYIIFLITKVHKPTGILTQISILKNCTNCKALKKYL